MLDGKNIYHCQRMSSADEGMGGTHSLLCTDGMLNLG